MKEIDQITEQLEHGKNPNFLLIVVVTGVVLVGLFVAAYLLLSDKGRQLLPGLHHDPHPTAFALPSTGRSPHGATVPFAV
jgi:hypothetical protein